MGGGLAGRKSLGRLGVMSELEIRSLSVQRCDRATNCGDCVALQVRFLSNFYLNLYHIVILEYFNIKE